MSDHDVAVIGLGGLGSATAYRLARRGLSVLGLEQFSLGHHNGGSQDHSRIIRNSYHDATYTALTPHSFTAWEEVEQESGIQLVFQTGGLFMAEAGGTHAAMIDTYDRAMTAAAIAFERLDATEITRRWPQFRFPHEVDGIFEPTMGLVDAGKGNAVHQALARAHGAELVEHAEVQHLEPLPSSVRIHLTDRKVEVGHVVLAAGAWTDELLAPLDASLRLRVTQEQVTYYRTPHLRDFAPDRFPTWAWEGEDLLYGFPVYGEVATKVGIDAAGPTVTARTRDYDPDPDREKRQHEWMMRHLPDALGPVAYTKTCLYDMPPDRNFVLDAVPGASRVLVAAGAGHAYKFAALIGQVMSDLVIDGGTHLPIAPFTYQRPAITDSDYQPDYRI